MTEQGREYCPGESTAFTVAEMEMARTRAGIEFETGDMIIIYTGFLEWYVAQPAEVRCRIGERSELKAAGIAHTEDMAEYLWDSGASAVVSDSPSVEVWPPDPNDAVWPFGLLHQVLIGQFGFSLGELWWLQDLVAACEAAGLWEVFIVSAPMNLPGGIGSTANAVAIT
jgi:kynurenine formamidase